jgi:hypothetical protein
VLLPARPPGDHGAVPAALGPIATELGIGFFGQGVLGAAPYLGMIAASLVTSPLLSRAPRAALAGSLLGECASLCLVVLSRLSGGPAGAPPLRWPLVLSRFGAGACQGVVAIYVPVWIDEFSPTASRAVWMASVQAAVPLGIMAGYLGTGAAIARLGPSAWWTVFVLQAMLLCPLAFAVLLVPRQYLAIDMAAARLPSPRPSPRRPLAAAAAATAAAAAATSRDDEGGAAAVARGAPVVRAPPGAPPYAPPVPTAASAGGAPPPPRVLALAAASPAELRQHARRMRVESTAALAAASPTELRVHARTLEAATAAARDARLSAAAGGGDGGDGGDGDGGGGGGEADGAETDSNLGGESGARLARSEWADLMLSAGAREHAHAHAHAHGGGGGERGGGARARRRPPPPPPPDGGVGGEALGGCGAIPASASTATSAHAPSPPSAAAAGGSLASVRLLLRSRVYVCCLVGLSALFFVVNGVQFWATQYLIDVLRADPLTALSAYAATSATAPVLGVLTGGAAVDRLAAAGNAAATAAAEGACALRLRAGASGGGGGGGGGGGACAADNAARAALSASLRRGRVLASMRVAVAFAAAAVCAAPCACAFGDVRAVVGCLWLVLFCGGATLAPVTGAMLSAVPRELRPLASAVSTLTSNLLGYALSSFLSGCVMATVRADRPMQLRVGFTLVLGWSAVALACFALGLSAAQREPGAAAAVAGLVAAARRPRPAAGGGPLNV